MNPEVRFTHSSRILAATLELKGPYDSWGRGLMELKAWMERTGISQSGGPFALFYDNPTETPAAQLRSEACIPVSKPFKSEGLFKFKVFPECEVAETKHDGSPDTYTSTYGAFLEHLFNSGCGFLGPAREFFRLPSADLGPGMGWLIQQPVTRPRQSHPV